MRTTLTIEDDVYFEAKHMASAQNRSIGSVLTELVRRALQAPELTAAAKHSRTELDAKLLELGVVPYYATSGKPVSNAEVNKLKEELDI